MIKGKRSFLANLLFHSGAYKGLRHFSPDHLVIFNYHRIRSENASELFFDEGVFGPTQEKFRDHLKWLKLNSDIISEGDLLDQVRGKRALPRSSVMITFDDGYVDNAELALPVLKELNIPAIFFISTKAIEQREVGWWDTIAYLIKQTKRKRLVLWDRVFDFELVGNTSKDLVIIELQQWMRTLSTEITSNLLNELSIACDVAMPNPEICSKELMSWDQIREVADSCVTIGSHTHTHRVLSTLSFAEQLNELQISKEILEREIKVPVHSVAYPVGGFNDYHLETETLAKKSGYELGFSFQTGANTLSNIRSFGIKRVSAEETLPLTCAAVMMPSIFARSKTGTKPRESSLQAPATKLSLKMNSWFLLLSLFLGSLSPTFAAEHGGHEDTTIEDDPSLTSNPNITIAPGFLLSISSPDDSKLNGDFRVSIDGKVYLPYDVIMNASGQRLKTFVESLKKNYQPYFQGKPNLNASIKQRRYWVKVLGLVKNPGNYLIKDRTSLDEALGMAQVKTEDLPSGFARITHGSRSRSISMEDYLKGGSAHDLPAWQGGEQIVFQMERPEVDQNSKDNDDAGPSMKKIQVSGEVKNPGTVSFQSKADAYYYLMQRGGPTREADLTEVELIRKNRKTNEHSRVSLGKAYDIKEIQEADILLVHPTRQTATERALNNTSLVATIISAVVVTLLVVAR